MPRVIFTLVKRLVDPTWRVAVSLRLTEYCSVLSNLRKRWILWSVRMLRLDKSSPLPRQIYISHWSKCEGLEVASQWESFRIVFLESSPSRITYLTLRVEVPGWNLRTLRKSRLGLCTQISCSWSWLWRHGSISASANSQTQACAALQRGFDGATLAIGNSVSGLRGCFSAFDATCGVFRVAGSLGFGGTEMATAMARTTVAVFLFLALSGYASALYGPSSDVLELTSTNFKNKVLS